MTATALDRIGTALTVRPATVFFDALNTADEHVDRHAEAVWTATFAPAVRSAGFCPCGALMECRDNHIELTDDEKLAAAEGLGDLSGRPLDNFMVELVERVVLVVNHERDVNDHQAMDDWRAGHENCGDDA